MKTNTIANVNEILKQILKQYEISDKDRKQTSKRIDEFIAQLKQQLKNKRINAKVMLGGSAAKSTYIKNDFDCDIFVRFNYNKYAKEEQNLSKYLQKALQNYKFATIHGSRDYYHVKIDDINYEIVPVLDIKDPRKAINVTDMSPLHVEWVKKRINNHLRDQIILTKVFFKANDLYGAESYVKAFSGHVVDILLAQYKTFLNLLKQSQKWKLFEVIDVEKYNTARWLNESKISPLIVIDPLLPSRNACAALSKEKFISFKEIARKFLDNPNKEFFTRKTTTAEQAEQQLNKNHKNKNIIIIKVTPLHGKEDIVLTKALKAFEYLRKIILENDFSLFGSGIDFSNKKEILYFFVSDKKILEDKKLIKGPAIEFTDGCKAFTAKHTSAFLKRKQWFAYEKRTYANLTQLIKTELNNQYIAERIKSAEL
ncbi:nucleotidyltransferase domain-containing protein [Candidatus Woesearchaeota archaeon]|nr:nucleotidyltransferase domain-containing protein [Candidatus Woesearchaeota archaeon]